MQAYLANRPLTWAGPGPGAWTRAQGCPAQEDKRGLELASKKKRYFDREVLQNHISGARLKSD